MDDKRIVDLYFSRNEEAIIQTDKKYGHYCYCIAYSILANREDAEESVSDTYMTAWRQIPPRRPAVLSTFLGKITRHISIDRWRERSAYKRGGGEVPLVLEELEDCVAGVQNVELEYARKEVIKAYIKFLDKLPITERRVFLCRYWYVESIEAIADKFGFSQSKVKTMLYRTRIKLRRQLAEEGYE
jgi:RNA polymerase sigma-70 factor (ECF subfamily)